MRLAVISVAGALLIPMLLESLAVDQPPIRFEYHPIDFTLENCETPAKRVPETMAGGVAVFRLRQRW